MLPRMLSVSQTAKKLGIPPKQIYHLIKTGKLSALQLQPGGAYRISTEEINRFKSQHSLFHKISSWLGVK